MKSIAELCREINEMNTAKGWDFSFEDTPEKIALMHTELSEMLEEYRKGKGPTEIYYPNLHPAQEAEGKPEGIPIEAADLAIRLFHFCAKLGIDLEAAIELKLNYNATRPHRHGGKRC